MRRNVVAATAAALSLAVLWGCSAIPTKSISAAQLQGLVLAGDLGLDPSFDTTFTTQPIALRNSTIESFWSESEGTPEECYPAYAASYLAGESSGDSDELADIAGFYPDAGGAINVFGRSFDSEGAASSFLDGLTDVAAECTDAGGYQLSDGAGGLGWDATAVSIESAADLSLPGGVTAAYQVEAVDAQYAALYRVTYLQFENVVVAVMAQQLEASVFTADQLDELAESVAERLARL